MSFAKNIEKNYSLREKCPNSEFFLACIFPHSDWIRRDTPYSGKFWASGDLIIFLKFSLFKPRRCSSTFS